MILLRKYDLVHSFTLVDEQNLCIRKSNSNHVHVFSELDLSEISVFTIENLTADNIYVIGDKVYYCLGKEYNKTYKYELHVNEFKSDRLLSGGYFLDDASIIRVNKLGNILSTNSELEDLFTQYIDIREERVMWKRNDNEYKLKLFDENYFISSNLGSLPKIKLIRNGLDNDVWTFDTNTITSLVSNTKLSYFNWGYLDHKLFGYLEGGEILILSLIDGELIDIKMNENRFGRYGYFTLDKNRRQLIKIFRDTYHLFNIDTGKFEFYELTDLVSKEDENIGVCTQDSKYLYFISGSRKHVNAFNKTTHKIEWKFTVMETGENNPDEILFYRLESYNDKLYLIDNKKTLYVFGK